MVYQKMAHQRLVNEYLLRTAISIRIQIGGTMAVDGSPAKLESEPHYHYLHYTTVTVTH